MRHDTLKKYSITGAKILFLGIIAVGTFWFTSHLMNQYVQNKYIENPGLIMENVPFYQIIKKHDKGLYDKLANDISLSLQNGDNAFEIKQKVRTYLNQYISKRIPFASDEAVINYMKVTLKEMEALQYQGYGLCYHFLYPSVETQFDIAEYVHQDIIQEDFQALTQVLESSYTNTQAPPNPLEVQGHLTEVYTIMHANYGNELNILNEVGSHNINKDKVCQMTINLFKEILKLPASESGATLRFLVMNKSM